MKAVIQRVKNAGVTVDGRLVGECQNGYMILLGVKNDDTETDLETLVKKVVNLRIFEDENGKMNLSILDIGGEILCISQFTLLACTQKGNRPSFTDAMEPVKAEMYYHTFCKKLADAGVKRVEKGVFGADMQVSLVNDGPVTIILDTEVWCKR